MAELPLTFDEFREQLARMFETSPDALQWETNFLEDLAFDSLRMLQLGMVYEDLGLEMPAELAWGIPTVGDAYTYYAAALQTPGAMQTESPSASGS
jgi:acyl carrier protein